MKYTVNQLAKISGISIRTLHYYDEIGLLKPAYYGNNNYRYYQEEQLLILQQILFYREVGVPLSDIERIVSSNDFDKVKALQSHRLILENNLAQTRDLIKTIDKTIKHLKGNAYMKNHELYHGFDSEKQKQYEQELIDKGIVTEDWMDNYKNKRKHWNNVDEDHFIKEGKEINDMLIHSIDNGLNPASEEVQAIIRRHHKWVGWNPTKEKYLGLAEMYVTMDYQHFYNKLDCRLLNYIVAAMRVFAERELK